MSNTSFENLADSPERLTAQAKSSAGILEQSMGARNRVGIGLSYRPARLHRLAEFIPGNRFLGSLKTGFDRSILRHSRIWAAAVKAMLNKLFTVLKNMHVYISSKYVCLYSLCSLRWIGGRFRTEPIRIPGCSKSKIQNNLLFIPRQWPAELRIIF
jgi:hypothetical protein